MSPVYQPLTLEEQCIRILAKLIDDDLDNSHIKNTDSTTPPKFHEWTNQTTSTESNNMRVDGYYQSVQSVIFPKEFEPIPEWLRYRIYRETTSVIIRNAAYTNVTWYPNTTK